jgi:hypothetical protein
MVEPMVANSLTCSCSRGSHNWLAGYYLSEFVKECVQGSQEINGFADEEACPLVAIQRNSIFSRNNEGDLRSAYASADTSDGYAVALR